MFLTSHVRDKTVLEDTKNPKMLHLDRRQAWNIILMSKVSTLLMWNKATFPVSENFYGSK